jgi:hypothetical protein
LPVVQQLLRGLACVAWVHAIVASAWTL